jgi:enoyl-[acyl-carrier-protein] reductase (NADH)
MNMLSEDKEEVANVAAFMASDYASALTGVIANVTCGYIDGYRRMHVDPSNDTSAEKSYGREC